MSCGDGTDDEAAVALACCGLTVCWFEGRIFRFADELGVGEAFEAVVAVVTAEGGGIWAAWPRSACGEGGTEFKSGIPKQAPIRSIEG